MTAIKICSTQVIPSLFLFLVISGIIIRTGIHNKIPKFISVPICKAFNISPPSVSAFIIGLVCGFPIGGKITADLYKRHEIDKEEAEKVIAFSNNTGPAFTIACVGSAILHNPRVGISIYFLQMTAAICIALFLRKSNITVHKKTTLSSENNFFDSICESVYDASASAVSICGFIIFFYTSLGVLSELMQMKELNLLLAMLCEVSSGSNISATLPAPISYSAAAFTVGWAGISVHMQTSHFLRGCGINMKKYYISKLFCGIFCAAGVFALEKTIYQNKTDSSLTTFTTPLSIKTKGFIFIFAILIFLIGFIISKLEKKKEV